MTNRKAFLAVVVAPLLAGQLVVVLEDKPKRRAAPARISPKAATPPAPIVYAPAPTVYAPAPAGDVAPGFSLKVRGDIRFPGDQAWSPRKISDILNQARIGVPEDRVRYFQPLVAEHAQKGYMLGGWDGGIEAITPTEDGLLVDLSVTARYGRLHDAATLMERYSIINGVVRYVGSWVPKNQLGGLFLM